MKAFGWWFRNGEVFLAALILVAIIGGASLAIIFGSSTMTHTYHQNYQCPYGLKGGK